VYAGGDLQAALNAAEAGDEVVLDSGAVFTGNFSLPPKPFSISPITLRSSERLEDRQVVEEDASRMATISSPNVITALEIKGTANWKIVGIRFTSNQLGAGNVVECQDVDSILIDRTLFVGGAQGQKRAVLCNGTNITITRNHWANVYGSGQDSQCFLAYDGMGPYTLRDNFFECASENIMFGGDDSKSALRIPSNILVERNVLTKRLEWKGQGRVVKNLFELKCAKNVTLRNNVLQFNWTDGQSGWGIVLTPRNQGGNAPWSTVTGVLIEQNSVFSERGVNILGIDDEQPSGTLSNITVRNNSFTLTSDFMQIGAEAGKVSVTGNRVYTYGVFLKLYGGNVWPAGRPKRAALYATTSFIAKSNSAWEHLIVGDNTAPNEVALQTYTLSHTVTW